jgi:hypothetical protein
MGRLNADERALWIVATEIERMGERETDRKAGG